MQVINSSLGSVGLGIVVELIGSEKQTNLGAVRWWDVGWRFEYWWGVSEWSRGKSFFFWLQVHFFLLEHPTTRWFKVPFSSPSWRSRTKSLNHPKKVTLNHQVLKYSTPILVQRRMVLAGRAKPSPATIDWFCCFFCGHFFPWYDSWFSKNNFPVQSFGKKTSLVLLT